MTDFKEYWKNRYASTYQDNSYVDGTMPAKDFKEYLQDAFEAGRKFFEEEAYAKGEPSACRSESKKSAKCQWVRCSERLPKERDWYLAVFVEKSTGFQLIPRVSDFMQSPEGKITTSDGWKIIDFEEPSDYLKDLICVAWQPLPEIPEVLR